MQPSLSIEILPGEAQIIDYRLNLYRGLAKAVIKGGPDNCTIFRHQFLRGAQMIIEIPGVNPTYLHKKRIGGPGAVRLVAVGAQFGT